MKLYILILALFGIVWLPVFMMDNLGQCLKTIKQIYTPYISKSCYEFTKLNSLFAHSIQRRRFLLTCKSNFVYPKNISARMKGLSTLHFYNTQQRQKKTYDNFLENIQYRLLKFEINDIYSHISYLNKKMNNLKKFLDRQVKDPRLLNKFYTFIKIDFDRSSGQFSKKFKRKFCNIVGNPTFFTDKYSDYSYNTVTSASTTIPYTSSPTPLPNPTQLSIFQNNSFFVNLTPFVLPQYVIDTLSLGPKFNVNKYNISKLDTLEIVKNIEHSITSTKIPPDHAKDIRFAFNSIIDSNLNRQYRVHPSILALNKKVSMTKKFAKDNPNIMFINSDKSNKTVCIASETYNESCLRLLSDKHTYLNFDEFPNKRKKPINIMNDAVSSFLFELNQQDLLYKKFKNKTRPNSNPFTFTECQLPKLYCLPKLHKPGIPFRPIVSTINSSIHLLAKVLLRELQKCNFTDNYIIKNSLSLVDKIKHYNIPPQYKLISLDVSSLFTNIPHSLVNIALDKRVQSIRQHCKIPYDSILEGITILFHNTYFQFNDNIYKQITGTPMGSPISPLLADLVMTDLVNYCLQQLGDHGIDVLFFIRYVDDTCLCVHQDFIDQVLEVFNKYDKHLQFTHEVETVDGLNFLDVCLKIDNGRIIYNWYSKYTSSGRFLNFRSAHPTNLKINMIYNLVDRAISLSHPQFHSDNLKKVRNLLNLNDYPRHFYNKHIKNRLSYHRNLINNPYIPTQQPKTIICVPFLNQNLFYQLRRVCSKYNLYCVPKINNRLDTVISLGKDRDKPSDMKGCVYTFNCQNCHVNYYGETSRSLGVRINAHARCYNKSSEVSLHMRDLGHKFDFDNVRILHVERNDLKRKIAESFFINTDPRNNINTKADIFELCDSYNRIFHLINRKSTS